MHLALFLQRNAVHTVLYADRTAEQLREGRLPNNVCRFGRTRTRERELDIAHWDFPDFGMRCAHVRIGAEPPIAFRADLTDEASYVDFRLYLPQLLTDYRARGGTVIAIDDPGIALSKYAPEHDLMVAATGRHRMHDTLFPRIPTRSAENPARLLLAGLFHGVQHTDPMGMHLEIIPGAGEIFQTPVHSMIGRVAGITFEAIPEGPWAQRVGTRYYDDPPACGRVVLDMLEEIDSEILDRIDREQFALTRGLDLLQGAITPTVRQPWTSLGAGRFAVAVGDAAVLNDPVTGQGGNLASASARSLGQAILAGQSFDEQFCRTWEDTLWRLSADVTEWTAAALEPPTDHVMDVLRAAQRNQRLADAFLDNFDNPTAMWNSLSTPQQAAAFIREHDLLNALVEGDIRAVAAEAILVTATGGHQREDWLKAIDSSSVEPVADFHLVPLTDTAELVTYRLGALHCSTVWYYNSAEWRVSVHHRSRTSTAIA